MSNNSQGGIQAGATSVSMNFELRRSADSIEQTGKVAADITLSYWRQGGLRVAQASSNLAAVNSVFAAGGVKEVDNTNMPGVYRVDWPDACFAAGVDWVNLSVVVAGCFAYNERITISDVPLADENADAILDRAAAIETGVTLRQALRLMLSTLCGKATGLEGTTVTFRNTADTKNRVIATVDSNGNRTAVTLDAS
jgi:hypothetical protein